MHRQDYISDPRGEGELSEYGMVVLLFIELRTRQSFLNSANAPPDRHSTVNHSPSNIVSTYTVFKLFICLQSFSKYFYNKRTKATLFVFLEGFSYSFKPSRK